VRRLLQGTLGVLLALAALSGCHKGSSSSSASPTHSAAPAHTATATTSAGSAAGTGTSRRARTSASSGTRTCPAGDASATINGKAKCLAVGQQCSAKAVSEYPAYGFVCEQRGSRYVLRKK
jgi:hypothetical protein